MAAGLKCPLPPPPTKPPTTRGRPPPPWTVWLVEDKEDKEELMNKEELMTLTTPHGTSHCSCLEHCFLFVWDLDTKIVDAEKNRVKHHLAVTACKPLNEQWWRWRPETWYQKAIWRSLACFSLTYYFPTHYAQRQWIKESSFCTRNESSTGSHQRQMDKGLFWQIQEPPPEEKITCVRSPAWSDSKSGLFFRQSSYTG